MGSSVYVLAVLGGAPAVLAELLWWVSCRERGHVAGVEVWTTTHGDAALREFVRGDTWERLQGAVGRLPDLQPAGTPPRRPPGFCSHIFRGPEGPLGDVRSEAESTVVCAALHDRVRALRGELDGVVLLGSLAGGRKTISTGLQTAFTLQARAEDRLVHVLLDASFEGWLRAGGHDGFGFPTPEWAQRSGVPEEKQLVVYDVDFPRLRCLVPRRLASALDGDWEKVWPVLEANLVRKARASLRRTGFGSWRFTIVSSDNGSELYAQDLGQRLGAFFAAAICVGGEDSRALANWMEESSVGWEPKDDSDGTQIRGAARDLRKKLRNIPQGLERFALPERGYEILGPVELDHVFVPGE